MAQTLPTTGSFDALARLARQTRTVVHVVVPRQASIVPNARAAAGHAGVAIQVDLRPVTVRVRFDGT
jgi:hypothetical protein